MERLDRGFRTADQIERVSGYTVLGLMPALESARGVPPERYVLDRPQSSFAESLRRVVAGLSNSPTSKPMKVLMVASAVPGEGKTSFSMALTRQIAASGRRVLLVEADLRRPRIGEALGSSDPSGLVDLLRQRKSLQEVIRIDNRSGAHYITAGIGEGSSQDLLASWQMKNLIRLASDQYDLVLIDTPPVMAVSDVASLGKLVDGGVMLVRWATTPRDVAINGLRQLAGYGVPILGIVLTQVDVKRYAKYSAGAYSVGGSRYSGYYSN
jgi:capsular exopolysaccharide synthesis family protein